MIKSFIICLRNGEIKTNKKQEIPARRSTGRNEFLDNSIWLSSR